MLCLGMRGRGEYVLESIQICLVYGHRQLIYRILLMLNIIMLVLTSLTSDVRWAKKIINRSGEVRTDAEQH